VTLFPPAPVRAAFALGVRLQRDGLGGEGLRPETIAWAKRLASGDAATLEKARTMVAWFARHGASPLEVAARHRQVEQMEQGALRGRAPALVAWLLWGGDPGMVWSQRLVSSNWERVLLP